VLSFCILTSFHEVIILFTQITSLMSTYLIAFKIVSARKLKNLFENKACKEFHCRYVTDIQRTKF
jgi:hypothetical protein